MTEREFSHQKAEAFFEQMWQGGGGDPWEFESSEFEQARYRRLLECLSGRLYPRILELGCGAGAFTRLLAPLAQEIVALDISPAAIARARTFELGPAVVDFRPMNVMDYQPESEGPWDLIVLSDTVYYLGWLYSFFDVSWFARRLFLATRPGGYCLLANAVDDERGEWLLRPWVIHTYRDLFCNVGYHLATEELFGGLKNDTPVKALISLLAKGTEQNFEGTSHD